MNEIQFAFPSRPKITYRSKMNEKYDISNLSYNNSTFRLPLLPLFFLESPCDCDKTKYNMSVVVFVLIFI